jgi:hypothetical protein
MATSTQQRTASTPAPGGRVSRPVLARQPANPRSLKEIIADAKKQHAEALAYLATR